MPSTNKILNIAMKVFAAIIIIILSFVFYLILFSEYGNWYIRDSLLNKTVVFTLTTITSALVLILLFGFRSR